ncbi:CDP-alcohol phosphatidyltransferase family protein [Methanolapillus millepedarum]|uniref:Phosphatidylinositol phosphate synthase n=1 Tax=Methanolapillus millepedarum TaxID=3028296 RepID=A0AA96V3Z3_9EURY|nr:Phosphatidylinositol phosphate synthase [Methanosarcinaceae archaeon Ac7]
MAVDSLRPFATDKFINPVAVRLVKYKITPDVLSVLSLLFSFLAGVSFYLAGTNYVSSSSSYWMLLVAGFCVLVNSGLDAFDGAVARIMGVAGKRGDFLDHVIDRYADVFIICGIIFGGLCPWQIGLVAIVGVLLTSYLGTQAQAMGIGRYYGGIMGRADRLVIILAGTFLDFIYILIYHGAASFYGLSFLGWVMVIIAILSHVTALQRIYYIWKAIRAEERNEKSKNTS